MSFLLRPHHALCVRFFEGKGYSPDFVRHMNDMIALLAGDDPVVTLSGGCDRICEACPKNLGGICETEEKVRAIDRRVLEALSYHAGDTVRWSELYEKANNEIVSRGRLSEICRDCRWITICNR